MDKATAIKIAKEYINFLTTSFDIESAILFGSYARGNYHDDSDIDIAIILERGNDIIDTQAEMMKLRRKIDLRIEPHPFFKKDFNHNNPVVNEILQQGIYIK